MIGLNVLGDTGLRDARGCSLDAVLSQPKRFALLVYLAVAGDGAYRRRDTLLGLFWPDLGMGRARGALSQALYFLRRELGADVIEARGNDELRIAPGALDCDLAAFDAALEAGRPERALSLYRGEFLAGTYLVDGTAWEAWLETMRERCRTRAAAAAWAAADEAAGAGDAAAAGEHGALALALSGDDEHGLRRLLTLLAAHGDRAAIARVYRDFAGRLRAEYGIEPSPETRDLYRRLVETSTARKPPSPTDDPRRETTANAPRRTAADAPRKPAAPRTPRAVGALRPGLALLALLVAGAFTIRWAAMDARGTSSVPGEASPATARIDLRILPFEDPGHDGAAGTVAGGLRAELSERLARIERLQVFSTPPGGSTVPREPGGHAAEPVALVLRGKLVDSPEGLAVGLELAHADGTGAIRSTRIALRDLLAASARAAEWVATSAMGGLAARDVARLREGVTADPAAFRLYLRGRHQLTRADGPAYAAARGLFEQALALDPRYAQAWSGLADALIGLAWSHALPMAVAVPRARDAAERALALNPGLAEGHASLAQLLNQYYWDSEGARRHFREALRLQPNNADAHLRFAAFLRDTGHPAQARREAEAALALDPQTFHTHAQLVVLDLTDGRPEAATERARQLVAVNGDVPMAHFLLARCLIALERWEEALAELERMGPRREAPPALTLRGYVLGRNGDRAGAREAARRIRAAGERMAGASVAFDLAVVHLGLGEHEQALAALGEAARVRDYRVRLVRYEPMFDELHGQPAFAELLRRAGLPAASLEAAAGSAPR